MIMLLFFTVLAVSVDAFAASLAYGIRNKLKIGEILYASSFTFIMCSLTLTLSSALGGYARLFRIAGGLIFIALGTENLLPEKRESGFYRRRGYRELAVLGIGVASDAALACLSLPTEGVGVIVCAFFMFAAHFLFICCGMAAADGLTVFASRLKILSGLFLVCMGIARLAE